MAPNSALAFVVLGTSLWGIGKERRWGRRFALFGAIVVGLISSLGMIEYLAGFSINQDQWFIAVPAGKFGLADVGKMSFMTAAAFVASCAGIVLRVLPRFFARVLDAVAIFGLIAAETGLVFSLGYLFSPYAPILYGTQTIPMALNEALGFALLGTGLVAAGGPGAFPLRHLSGPSTRARLLRVFLPLIAATVVVVAWLSHVVSMSSGGSSTAIASAILATVVMLSFGLICERIARQIGKQLERVEEALRKAHDELEDRIAERTRELIQAKALLERRNRELQQVAIGLKLEPTDTSSPRFP